MAAANTSEAAIPPDGPESPARRGVAAIALVALAFSAVMGGNLFGLRDQLLGVETPEARPAVGTRTLGDQQSPPATSAAGGGQAAVPDVAGGEGTLVRSQPWWQGLTTAEGTGAAALDPLGVDPGAIQWRVNATCEGSSIAVLAEGQSEPVLSGDCDTAAVGYGTSTGDLRLRVESDGPWSVQVEQQIDVPLVEPPLPAMTAPDTSTVVTGEFYRIDQRETGTVSVYRLADGSHALRLDDFFVTPNVDLEIVLSPLEAPQTTEEFMSAEWVKVAPLDVTAGSMNFLVPDGVDPAAYGSVVIWCPLIDSAYAAASLTPPG